MSFEREKNEKKINDKRKKLLVITDDHARIYSILFYFSDYFSFNLSF